jgi:hypothetical protein
MTTFFTLWKIWISIFSFEEDELFSLCRKLRFRPDLWTFHGRRFNIFFSILTYVFVNSSHVSFLPLLFNTSTSTEFFSSSELHTLCTELPAISAWFDLRKLPYGNWSQIGRIWSAIFYQAVVVHSRKLSLSLSSGPGAVWTLCPNLDVQHWFVSLNQWLNPVSPAY